MQELKREAFSDTSSATILEQRWKIDKIHLEFIGHDVEEIVYKSSFILLLYKYDLNACNALRFKSGNVSKSSMNSG